MYTRRSDKGKTVPKYEGRFQDLIQGSREGLFILDELGRIRFANGKGCSILGQPLDAILDRPLLEYFDYKGRVTLTACLEAQRANRRGPPASDISLRSQTGPQFRVSVHVDSTSWPNVKEAFAVRLLDITEQSVAKERLQTAYSILNSSPAVVFIWENKPGWPVIFVSENVINLLGYESWDFLSGRIMYKSLIHPEDLSRLVWDGFQPRSRSRSGPQLIQDTYRVLTADGSERWVRHHIGIQNKETERPTQFHGIVIDITPQMEMQSALRQSEERFRSVLDSSPFPIVLFEGDGGIGYVNPSFVRLTGYGQSAFAGLSSLLEALFPNPEVHSEIEKVWPDTWASEENPVTLCVTLDNELLTAGGGIKNVTVTFGYMSNQEHYIILQDTTEKVQAEAERKQLQEYVYQAQKMDAIGTLAGGIAHEFNNLLQGLKGSLDIIRLRNTCSPKHLERMDKNILRASELVRGLLTFSRQADPQLQAVDLNVITENALMLVQKSFPKTIAFDVQLCPDLYGIHGDVVQLEHILLNLLNNARDALSDQPQGTISVTTRMIGKDQCPEFAGANTPTEHLVRLEISDTGQGMESEVVKQIFDPFFSTKEVGKGTGLGLSTVYGMVKAHGATISCHSKPGRGTTFTLNFPALQESSRASAHTVSASQSFHGRERILLIDDEPLILETVQEILDGNGYRVWIADRGQKALQILQDHTKDCDLIILDLGLPEMSGEACLQELAYNYPEKPVIVASGYLDHPIAFDPHHYGAAAFLGKPYTQTSMLSLIRNVLDKQAALPSRNTGSLGAQPS